MSEKFNGTVEKLVYGGSGLIRHNGVVIFVRNVLPQEEVTVEVTRVKAHYAEGRLLSILKPSVDRIRPRCPHFGQCGGCQLQHATPSAHAPIKQSFLQEALYPMLHPHIDMISTNDMWAWRRKITLHTVAGEIGYLGYDNKTLIPITDCPIFFYPEESKKISALKTIARKISSPTDISCFRLPNHNLSITIKGTKTLPKELIGQLTSFPSIESFSIHCPSWNHSEGPQEFSFESLGRTWFFSVHAFIQNHPAQSEQLWRTVIQRVTTSENHQKIVDLYSGIGVTAITLARLSHSVTAVECSKQACASAKRSAENTPIHFLCSTVETAIPKLQGEYDWWILNPPRTGLSTQAIEALIAKRPKNIIYISCSPATLARDCKILTKKKWNIVWGKAFDLFPQTTHFETIVHLNKTTD